MHRIGLLFLLVVVSANGVWGQDADAPKGPPEWKVEVVHEQPTVNYCSVVCCAPDGRVFLAEDPMDMVGPPNQPIDRILCLHPDGKITVYAEKLYAIFGLVYMDGKLYVHHSPRFSVFDDGGTVGKNRVDLIDCTHPQPWGGMNDHIPSNFRLGMDGWFYMSTGDKGIYGAVGKDGSKAEIWGGGIMRFRPDGTKLEVFSTGTRNHLDVAINAEDEIFTYDNTDDGLGWWTKVTHMVDGGFYGYPYDYRTRRPYTLWMMADYGGGSPTGGLAYNEDALPEEYRGNLFMCEWGKGQLARFIVQREGGSYKIIRREEFLTKGKKEFRPVGIAVSADGMSFYLADWNFGGWSNRSVKAGRLIKATYQGKSLAAPKPTWFIPAAQGQPFEADTKDLIQALRHPAQSVRLVAMRRAAERGKAAVPLLVKLMQDNQAPSYARWSALWTLDRFDQGSSARTEILALLHDPDSSMRRQVARQLGTRVVKEATPQLVELLGEDDRSVRFHAATALGRIGDARGIDGLLKALDDADLFTRYSIFAALGRIGEQDPNAWTKIAVGLTSDRTPIREATLFAFRDKYDRTAIEALVKAATQSNIPDETRGAVLALLGELSIKRPAWKGNWWGTQPARSLPPTRSVTWAGTEHALTALKTGLQDPKPLVRQGAAHGLMASEQAANAEIVVKHITKESDVETRRSMLDALARVRNPNTEFTTTANTLLLSLLEDSALLNETLTLAGTLPTISSEVVSAMLKKSSQIQDAKQQILLLEALSKSNLDEATTALIAQARAANVSVKLATIKHLTHRKGDQVSTVLVEVVKDQDGNIRREAIQALAKRRDQATIPALLEMALDKSLRFEASLALAAMPDERAIEIYIDGVGSKNNKQRDDCGRALAKLKKVALPRIETRLKQMPALSGDAILQLQKIYSEVPEARKSPLFQIAAKTITPEEFAAAAMNEKGGNAARGKKLFFDAKGVACNKCHRIGNEGGDVGPDLSSIAIRYQRAQLAESILYPSKQILDGYHVTLIETKKGQVIQGIVRGDNGDELNLVDAEGKKILVKKADIETRTKLEKSIMPDGLQTGMTIQEFADLLSYLETLRDPVPLSGPARKE